jgi:hypothetical protein
MFDRIVNPLTRDLNELLNAGPLGWLVLAALVLLPVLAVVLARARSRLALWSLALYLAVWAEMLVYYGTGYRGSLGIGRELLIHALPMWSRGSSWAWPRCGCCFGVRAGSPPSVSAYEGQDGWRYRSTTTTSVPAASSSSRSR